MTEAPALDPVVLGAPVLPPKPRIPRLLGTFWFIASRQRRAAADLSGRSRLHAQGAGVRGLGDDRRPGAGQAGLHHQPRGAAQHPAQPEPAARQGLRSPSTVSITAAGASCSPRRFTAALPPMSASSKRRRCARWRPGTRAPSSRPSSDDADHPQCDPARGVRSRRRRAAADARADAPVGDAGPRLAVLPTPTHSPGRWSPWARLAAYRREYEALIDRLIDKARNDPHFEERTDILSLFLRSTYDDGSTMSRGEIGDELADPAGRRARDHRLHPRLGVRADLPAPRGAAPPG